MYTTNNKQQGFTLIELVMVIVILGILAATALPKFVNLSTEANDAVDKGLAGAVKSALTVQIASRAAQGLSPIEPTVAELADAIQPRGTAEATGVKVSGKIVKTYTNDACTTATAATTDRVACVGDI